MKELELFKLEERVLFEAAAAAEIVDAAEAAQVDPNAAVSESDRQAQAERDALKNAPAETPAAAAAAPAKDLTPENIADVDAEIDALLEGEIPSSMLDNSNGKELVVINGTVADKEAILAELKPNQEVLILEDGNGLNELNEYLASQDTKYSAIHFVTHGNDGYISVNGELINAENFDAAQWQEIGEHLTENGDILLYGCDTAANAEGKLLVGMIAEASGADVSASIDATGISGNWDLEYTSGVVESSEIKVENFEHNLTNTVVTTADDVVDDTDSKTSLREAILYANDNAGTEITFEEALNGQTITLDSALGALGIKESVTITGNGVGKTIISGQDECSIFTYTDFKPVEISIQNMTLQDAFSDSTSSGGAISIQSIGDIHLSLGQVTITGSAAAEGSAIYVESGSDITLDIVNSTISGNSDTANGAIYVSGNSFKVNAVNSTITGNHIDTTTNPSHSGALYLKHSEDSSLNILNSIVYGNTHGSNAADVYADNTKANVSLTAVYSIYGNITDGSNNETFTPHINTGSTQLELTAANTNRVFGTNAPAVNSNGVIEVNNKDIAGYAGTLVAQTAAGFFYQDGTEWKGTDGQTVTTDLTADILSLDETGNSRLMAQNYLGVKEYFVGAAAGKVFLQVTPQSATYKYDGNTKTAAVEYKTAKGTTIDPAALPSGVAITATGITTSSANAKDSYELNNVDVSITASNTSVTSRFDLEIDQTAKIKITPREVTLTSATDSKTYDGTALTNDNVTVSGDGFVQGEGAVYNVTGSQTDVGSSSNTFTYTLNGNTLESNYIINTVEGTLTVNKGAAITVTSNSAEKTYDGTALTEHSFTQTGGALATGHRFDMTYTGTQTDAGNSENTFSYVVRDANGNDVTGNYDISSANGTLTVNQLALDLSFVVNNKTYDGNTDATLQSATADNIVAGDDLVIGVNAADADFDDANAGNNKNVTISAGLTLSGADAGNYKLVYQDNQGNDRYTGTADIDPKMLDIAIMLETEKTYDGTTDVESSYVVNGVVGTDDVTVSADWQYNSPNVAEADRIITTQWEISGASSGNYALPEKPADIPATITAKDVTIVYDTDEPYYYDSTDQSDTVSAYYTDINGNKINVPVNWNGKIFAPVGSYEITISVTDPNYNPVNASRTLVMLPADPGAGITPEMPGNLANLQTEVLLDGSRDGSGVNRGNIYTMNYSELISETLRENSIPWMDQEILRDSSSLYGQSGVSRIDTLVYKPMTIDLLVRESSLLENSRVLHVDGLILGQELFTAPADTDAAVDSSKPYPVPAPAEAVYEDGQPMAEDAPWAAMPEASGIAADLALLEQQLQDICQLGVTEPVKGEAFTSDYEKLLEELVKG